jgi:hypothetical protein
MKRFIRSIDPFIVGGWICSFFTGIITPHQIKLIISSLDVRVITIGSLLGSLFPLLTGLAFENRRLVRRLYARLPLLMLVEVLLALASVGFYSLSRSYYYVFSMAVFGLFSSTVMYLMQDLKQRRYRRKRAAFDRRYAMADACGYLAGSLLVLADWRPIQDVKVLLALGLLQTVLVYLLYLRCYRARPTSRRRARAVRQPTA